MQSLHYHSAIPCTSEQFTTIWLHYMQLQDLMGDFREQPYLHLITHPVGGTIALQLKQARQWDAEIIQKQLFAWMENVFVHMPYLADSDSSDNLQVMLLKTTGQTVIYSKSNARIVWHHDSTTFEIQKNKNTHEYQWFPLDITPDVILTLCENILLSIFSKDVWTDEMAIQQLEYLTKPSAISTKNWMDIQFVYLGWLLNNSNQQANMTDLWQWIEHAYDDPKEALRMFISALRNPVEDFSELELLSE